MECVCEIWEFVRGVTPLRIERERGQHRDETQVMCLCVLWAVLWCTERRRLGDEGGHGWNGVGVCVCFDARVCLFVRQA